MLWPPARRGERITLACGCSATVVWRMPVMFIYRVRIDHTGSDCVAARHIPRRRLFAGLEAIASRREGGSP